MHEFIGVVSAVQSEIDSAKVDGLTSDIVLRYLKPGLTDIGFTVETGKTQAQKIRRPVLFGDYGAERVAYEVDAVQDRDGIIVEIEAGRGARGNAVYRDLIRSSLIVDAKYFALGVMPEYRHRSGGKAVKALSYSDARNLLDAVHASGRLRFPFEGILLFGY